jgi:dTDP-4-dehydrorhamnose reductase
LLFHRQLRIQRGNPRYKACFEKAFQKTEEVMIDQWASFFQLEGQPNFAKTFLHLVSENFLLQIHEDTYGEAWLNNYLEEITNILKQMYTITS